MNYLLLKLDQLLCWMGLHRWDMPGGHCESCGACDEFFGPHDHDRNKEK